MTEVKRTRRMLVPFTGRRMLERVLEAALSEAEREPATVTLLRLHPPSTISPYDGEKLYSELRALRARLSGRRRCPVSLAVQPGRAVHSVLAYAGSHDMDVVVLPNPDRLDVADANWVGRLIADGRCPVRVVEPAPARRPVYS